MRALFNIARKVAKRIHRILELHRYDDFTIAEYFRKQGSVIGEHCRIYVRTLGQEPYLVKIGNHCTIAANVLFLCHDGATWLFTEEHPSLQRFGAIEIRDNSFIGINAMIMPNVTIGPNAVVGAGAVVTRDVPEGAIVAGNPARVVSTVDQFKKKALKLWELQQPAGYFSSLEPGRRYSPAEIQQMKRKDMKLLEEHLISLYRKKALS